MTKDDQIKIIEETGVIAIVRFTSSKDLLEVAKAISKGGVKVIEFTMTTPGALETIAASVKEFGDSVLLGAGTVLDPETARAAILAGAQFIVSPTLSRELIEICRRYSKTIIPGAYTPTEILQAWQWGADFVKLFPAEIGGPPYLKAIKAPLPQVKVVPVGGVSLSNVKEFIRAGAAAVAVGSNLVDKKLVAAKQLDQLTENARAYIREIQSSRSH